MARKVTPIHKSLHIKLKPPKTDTKIEDKNIPSPTPIKWAVLSDFLPNAWIEGRINEVPKINTKALDTPDKNLTIIKYDKSIKIGNNKIWSQILDKKIY